MSLPSCLAHPGKPACGSCVTLPCGSGFRVCNSDVAGESSSEYESGYDKEEEPSVEGPFCLKPKVSHTLAYVPSVYDR